MSSLKRYISLRQRLIHSNILLQLLNPNADVRSAESWMLMHQLHITSSKFHANLCKLFSDTIYKIVILVFLVCKFTKLFYPKFSWGASNDISCCIWAKSWIFWTSNTALATYLTVILPLMSIAWPNKLMSKN